jgi:hypothetical protein
MANPNQQPNSPVVVTKTPLADYQFVPRPGYRISPIPSRMEGQVQINLPGMGTTQR